MGIRGWTIGLFSALAVFSALTSAGCGGSSAADKPLTPRQTHVLEEGGILASPPHIHVPQEGLPPKKLVIKDLKKGTGTEAQKGDEVQIQYFGVIWGSGAEHGNSWRYAHIPTFELGSHRLIRGLTLAVRGMREGGAREVIVPYNLVYYPHYPHGHLSPLDALIYKVYLVKVTKKHS